MAEKLTKFDFTAPSAITSSEKAVYPWEEWLDGDIWQIAQGTGEDADFETHPLMMERIIRTRATARGAKVRMRHLPGDNGEPFGVIVLQRTDVVGPAQAKKAEQAEKRATKKAAAKQEAEAIVAKMKPTKTLNGKAVNGKVTKSISKSPSKRAAKVSA